MNKETISQDPSPAEILGLLGWTSEKGESNGAPATFWTLNDDTGDEEIGACVSDGAVHGMDAFHDYSPAELRAFAQLAEESSNRPRGTK